MGNVKRLSRLSGTVSFIGDGDEKKKDEKHNRKTIRASSP